MTGVQAAWRIVSPSYFRTLDVPVLRGRIFTRGADPGANPSIVISRALAEKLWPTARTQSANPLISAAAST